MTNRDTRFDFDPEAFRQLGYTLIDAIVDQMTAESDDPVLPAVSGPESRQPFTAPAPRQGRPAEDVLREAIAHARELSRKNGHPRFFGYVCASADPVGILADALASAANQNLTAWRSSPGATEMERQVVRWLDEALGFQGTGHGLLLSGGSAANAHGLACAAARARQQEPGQDAKQVFYLSKEAHLSLRQAILALGFDPGQVRQIDVDNERRLDTSELEKALLDDLDSGRRPACVCVSAGTANTGAIDPLERVAELCLEHGVWMHIDGAYGAPAALSESHASLKAGFALADSMSIDPHKWLFAPFDVGCVLVRDPSASRLAFSRTSEYIAVEPGDEIETFAFFDHGPELSRRFRALKVWMILQVRGIEGLGKEIERQIELRRHLDRRIGDDPRLELLGSGLSISCFRYRPELSNPQVTPEQTLDHLNKTILEGLVSSGRFFLSPTTLDGRFSLRICIVNFRTRRADIDLLVDEILRLGEEAQR